RFLDQHYVGCIFLAEVTQTPADIRAYFGEGDECHMAYHFPLVPRLFLALCQEDRTSITDMLQQTPALPANYQWALFLRNCTLAKITHRRRFHYRCIGAKSPWVPERRFGTLARRQEGEEQSG